MSYASDALIDSLNRENERLDAENASLRGAVLGLGELCDKYKSENAKLRDERARYEDLVRILDSDWGIEASWDGLRRLWCVGLTETGMKERDALDVENVNLKKRVIELEYENMMMFLELVGRWIKVKQREMEAE